MVPKIEGNGLNIVISGGLCINWGVMRNGLRREER